MSKKKPRRPKGTLVKAIDLHSTYEGPRAGAVVFGQTARFRYKIGRVRDVIKKPRRSRTRSR